MKTKTNYLLGILLSTFLIIGIINTTNGITIDTNPDTSKLHTPSLFSLLLGNSSNPVEMSVATGSNNLDILNGLIIGKNHTVTGSPKLSVIGGGFKNKMQGNNAGIGGGQENEIHFDNGAIGGGYKNKIEGPYGIIGGGNNNKASNYGIILGGNSNTSNNYGIILGGKSNSGNNSLVLGSNAKGQNYSFAWNGSASANSARINTTGGMLIGTYDPIAGVSLVVSGAIKISSNNSSNSSGGIFVDTGGCIQFYDGNVKNTLGDVSKNNTNYCGSNTGCKFGEATLHNGDKVTAYSVSYAKDCQSASGEAICKNGNMVDYKNQNSHKFIYPYCYDLSPDPIIVVNEGYQECREGLPEHAEWVNPYFDQKLIGDTYSPQQPTAHLDSGNGNPCSYKCEEGYVYIENQCIRPQATCGIDSNQRFLELNNSDLCIDGSVSGSVVTTIEELNNKYQAKRSWTCKNDYNFTQCSAIRPTANFYTYDDGSDLTFKVTKDKDWNIDTINFSGVTIHVNGGTTQTIKFKSTTNSYKVNGLGGAEMTNQNSVRYGNECRNRSGVQSSNCGNPTNKLFWVKDGYVIIGNNKLSDKNIAYLITGESINNIMRTIAGNQINNFGYPRDTNIKYVKTYTGNPNNIPSSAKIISTNEGKEVKMWYNNGTIYYYTDASKIYLNPDSREMFSELRSVQTIDTSGWDTSNVENMSAMFMNCRKLNNFNLSNFNTSNVEDMSFMFYDLFYDGDELGDPNISGWDTSNVKNMSSMFNGSKFKSLNISGWNTSNVKDMSAMFVGCENLTSLDIGKRNTSSVKDMNYMLAGLTGLTSLDLSGWDTSNVTDMHAMFMLSQNLNNLNLSNWDTRNVTGMYEMFSDCKSLTNLDLSNWNTSKVTDMHAMFFRCNNLNTIYASTGFITTSVAHSESMFHGATSLVGGNGTIYTSSHTNKEYARIDKSGQPGYFTEKSGNSTESIAYLIPGQDINNMMKSLAGNLNNIKYFKMYTGNSIPSGVTTTGISTDISPKGVDMWYDSSSQTIYYYTNANKIYLNKDSSHMFDDLENVETIETLKWNTTKVLNMSYMFSDCKELKNLNVKVSDGWYTDNVKNMTYMFQNCKNLTNLELSNWKTDEVESMKGMFYGCSSLTSLDLSNWNTRDVLGNGMESMFYGCSNLQSIKFGEIWNMVGYQSSVKSISSMFNGCSSLTSLDLSSWNTSEVIDMSSLFLGCTNLKNITFGNNRFTNKVTNMSNMFNGCSSLTNLDLSSWNTSQVQEMKYMFNGCSNLTNLDLSSWNTSQVQEIQYMFQNANNLKKIYASENFKVDHITNSSYSWNMFKNVNSIKGGIGTTYNSSKIHKEYARLDCGSSNPGYFSKKDGDYSSCTNAVNIYANIAHYGCAIDGLKAIINGHTHISSCSFGQYVNTNVCGFAGKLPPDNANYNITITSNNGPCTLDSNGNNHEINTLGWLGGQENGPINYNGYYRNCSCN